MCVCVCVCVCEISLEFNELFLGRAGEHCCTGSSVLLHGLSLVVASGGGGVGGSGWVGVGGSLCCSAYALGTWTS